MEEKKNGLRADELRPGETRGGGRERWGEARVERPPGLTGKISRCPQVGPTERSTESWGLCGILSRALGGGEDIDLL